jgi:hypothetical protein
LAAATAILNDLLQLCFRGRTYPHAESIVCQDLHAFEVVGGPSTRTSESRHNGMNATRIIPDHSSDRAMSVGGRIWAKGEFVFRRCMIEVIVDDAGLDAGELFVGIEFDQAVHVF